MALTKPNNKRSLRQTSHYHLARQLATLQRSGLQLTFPQGHATLRGNALSETLSKIHYDPQDLGLACKIPIEVFRPLMDIVNNMTELCGRSAHMHVMLSADELKLKLKYGNIVRKEHKVALNQLTKILNRDQTNVDITGPTFRHSAALSKDERVIKRPEILSDLTGQGTRHLQSHSMNSVECSALQLLQQYHHEVSKKRPSEPSKRKFSSFKEERHKNAKYILTYTSAACTTMWLADGLGVSPTRTKTLHHPKLRDAVNA